MTHRLLLAVALAAVSLTGCARLRLEQQHARNSWHVGCLSDPARAAVSCAASLENAIDLVLGASRGGVMSITYVRTLQGDTTGPFVTVMPPVSCPGADSHIVQVDDNAPVLLDYSKRLEWAAAQATLMRQMKVGSRVRASAAPRCYSPERTEFIIPPGFDDAKQRVQAAIAEARVE